MQLSSQSVSLDVPLTNYNVSKSSQPQSAGVQELDIEQATVGCKDRGGNGTLSQEAARPHSFHLSFTQQTRGITNFKAILSLALVVAIEVSVSSLISQRSAQAQRSNTADPKLLSK